MWPEQSHLPERRWSMAWPVALVCVAMVVYATLYPFSGWRAQAISPWAFLFLPWPRYWTAFDLLANLLGYMPLGLLLTLAVARSGHGKLALWVGMLGPACLSVLLETLQGWLPQRVPSNVDCLLNALGGALGTLLAYCLLKHQVLGPWVRFRADWLVTHTHGGLLLLLLWPLACLYPTSIPFGLGQVWSPLEAALQRVLAESSLANWLPVPVRSIPLSPLGESGVVALSLWATVLLAFAVLRRVVQRAALLTGFALLVLGVACLSAALTYGPAHAVVWLTPSTGLGLLVALAMSIFSLFLRHRTCAVLMLLAWSFALGLLNQAPPTPYLAQSLEPWEQGRFIRFHGFTQWLGWLWPYLALLVGVRLALQRPQPPSTIPGHV